MSEEGLRKFQPLRMTTATHPEADPTDENGAEAAPLRMTSEAAGTATAPSRAPSHDPFSAPDPYAAASRPVSSDPFSVPRATPAPATPEPMPLRVRSEAAPEAAPRAHAAPGPAATGRRQDEGQRRPRVALMGEFSAGKSTLSNLLIGKAALPVNVTATQLPPVWMSWGDDEPYRVGLDGEEHDIDPSLKGIRVADTHYLRIFHQAKFLKTCDLIDMPGISDPNMSAEVWRRVIGEADIVIWCSHATQAWRQSEAAVWSTMPTDLYKKSLLLLTRMDRILSERDRTRVIRRVEKETEGLFRRVLPVSLIKALEAQGDSAAWEESGADEMISSLMELIDEVRTGTHGRRISRTVSRGHGAGVDSSIGEEVVAEPKRIVMPTRIRPRPLSRRL